MPCLAGTKLELTLNAMFYILRSFVISVGVCIHCELFICLIVLIINKLAEIFAFYSAISTQSV